MKTPKRAVVSKKLSDEEKLNASRWSAFIKASGYSFRELTDEWMEFFDAQAEPKTASTELVRLIDAAIESDKIKENKLCFI